MESLGDKGPVKIPFSKVKKKQIY